MIEIKDKSQCCGCSACVSACPKECISMQSDSEGFAYPVVDRKSCIGCGLCEKVCPFINPGQDRKPVKVYAAKNSDEVIRMKSSSGGVFYALAESVIKNGGVVFGARFDASWNVVHGYAETVDELYSLMGSKYVQSSIGKSYVQVEHFLKIGRQVLFSGTPCQTSGLMHYLKRKYDNLFTVAVICHGVPSPGIWRNYLDEEIKRSDYGKNQIIEKNTVLSSSEDISEITDISFRDKISGWKNFSFVVRGKPAVETDKRSVLLSDIYKTNTFMKLFLSDLDLRPSCYACAAKGGRACSDIILGDFWGIENVLPDFDDDKGCSVLLIYNEHLLNFVNELSLEKLDTSLDKVSKDNYNLYGSVRKPINRSFFFNQISKGRKISSSYWASTSTILYWRLRRKIYRIVGI